MYVIKGLKIFIIVCLLGLVYLGITCQLSLPDIIIGTILTEMFLYPIIKEQLGGNV